MPYELPLGTVAAANHINHAAKTNGTVNGTSVDMQGYASAYFAVNFGTWTDGTHTPTLAESDDNSTFTAVAAADQQGTLTAVSAGGGSNTTQVVAYKGSKRYARIQLVTSGATTGAVVGAISIKGRPLVG